ncbi:hypothetical protein CAP35_05105 [Chitinophagaceae bacterium IBVUCB1]|jgi:2'-5' RNA ligase|nr:hypothetical protein CAP35_05105 [Chitinophagaceae bacterium IBVUCB1]
MPLYSIAILPDAEATAKVVAKKKQLKEAIGWFNTVNTLPYITISTFEAGDIDTLPDLLKKMAGIAARQPDIKLRFNQLMKFDHGAFCIVPDEESETKLRKLMADFQQLPVTNTATNRVPHITIGNGLSDKELRIAGELITDISLRFQACSIAFRKLNTEADQYDMIEEFPFRNGYLQQVAQQSLF